VLRYFTGVVPRDASDSSIVEKPASLGAAASLDVLEHW
jgi:hypothetical protein